LVEIPLPGVLEAVAIPVGCLRPILFYSPLADFFYVLSASFTLLFLGIILFKPEVSLDLIDVPVLAVASDLLVLLCSKGPLLIPGILDKPVVDLPVLIPPVPGLAVLAPANSSCFV